MGLDNASPTVLGINILMFVLFIPVILFVFYYAIKFLYKHGNTFLDSDDYDKYKKSQKGGSVTKYVTTFIFICLIVGTGVGIILSGRGRGAAR
jgi:predicted PurR-regulated permease PerM